LSHGRKWDFAAGKSLFSQWPNIDSNGIKRLAKGQLAVAPLSLIAVHLFGNPIAANSSSDPTLQPSAIDAAGGHSAVLQGNIARANAAKSHRTACRSADAELGRRAA
jgi:hypothetical protein